MILFKRYEHVNGLVEHYVNKLNRNDINILLSNGIKTKDEAEIFSKFIWDIVEHINEDEENEVPVLGSIDNTDMLPDISYEVSKYMKDTGFYDVWLTVSEQEM